MMLHLPDSIRDVTHLDDLLSQPTPAVIETLRRFEGDWLILGAAGKMGPSLSRMVHRAMQAAGRKDRVIAVSRFSSPGSTSAFTAHGIETLSADLLDPVQLNNLPDAPNVIFMAGMKFGSTGQEARTWAMNTFLPGTVAQRFRASRIVAFSTGNIYGLVPVNSGGSIETDTPAPDGEYAISCLGRERMFEHFSRELSTPVSIVRLNYAVEMRYGVLRDIALRVWNNHPIDLAMGNVNVIWQADANAMAIASLAHAASPPFILNVAGPEYLSVAAVARQFGALFDRQPNLIGAESPTALLNNGQLGHRLFGYPRVPVQQILHWTADWITRGGASLDKPTHFEARDGKF